MARAYATGAVSQPAITSSNYNAVVSTFTCGILEVGGGDTNLLMTCAT